MRRIRIVGLPPTDWIAEADALTQRMLDVSNIQLEDANFQLRLLPGLTWDSELPSLGTSLLAIGEVGGGLRLRAFDYQGEMFAEVKEPPRKSQDSDPIAELKDLLRGNWVAESLKPIEKRELYRLASSIVRSHLINEVIKDNEGLWRDDRIRNWLLRQFNNKCWYSESIDGTASVHVDHYRPKGRIKDNFAGRTGEGYWWLAFDWKNYRICGQLLNVKKCDVFPILEGLRCTHNDPVSLGLEAPVLIDPCTDQARLISYEKDEDACIAVVAAGISEQDEARVDRTIEILGLNLRDRLNQKRNDCWDKCLMRIADYKGAKGPAALRQVAQAAASSALKEMIRYDEEFSSVSEACIRKNAPEPLIATVFDGM